MMNSEDAPLYTDALIGAAINHEQGEFAEATEVADGLLITFIRERQLADPFLASSVRPQVLESLDRYRAGMQRDEWSRCLLKEAKLTDFMDIAAAESEEEDTL
jgi:hypothetical protein